MANLHLRPRSPNLTAFDIAIWAYPVVFIASLYLTWLAAWWWLGHEPRLNVDDPKCIGGIVDPFCTLTAWMLICLPVAAIGGPILTAWRGAGRGMNIPQALVAVWFLVVIWAIAVVLLMWDPLGVLVWFMD